ncbi:hypothetical protein D9M71_347020 [compost metagenome]
MVGRCLASGRHVGNCRRFPLADHILERHLHCSQLGHRRRDLGPRLVLGIHRQAQGCQDPDDRYHDEQLDQGKTFLIVHVQAPCMSRRLMTCPMAAQPVPRPEAPVGRGRGVRKALTYYQDQYYLTFFVTSPLRVWPHPLTRL